ncbi:MAG TPA: thiamine-phosphate kinase [Chthoniobacterales bacterium]
MNLRDVGEDRLLERILPKLPTNRDVVRGAGDDCALVRFGNADDLLVLKTDCVVERVHFKPETRGADVGWKAMARPLSDFAATSAVPRFAMITVIAPASTAVARIESIYRGITKAARRFEVAIVGGEMSATPGPLAISISITGSIEDGREVTRAGGKPGDEIFVTGTLGGSIRAKHLSFVPRIEESRWLTSRFRVHAMMDLSDGIGADLPRLAHASGVAFELDEASLPRTRGCTVKQAISDGEDYELLFAVGANESERLQREWQKKFPKLALTRIGRLVRQSKMQSRKLPRGYVHFA